MSQIKAKKINLNKIIKTKTSGPCDTQTFQESFRLIFYLSKFLGYSLFKLPKINLENYKICQKFKIETTPIDFAVLVTVIVAYMSLIYYNTILRFSVNRSESLILMMGGQICLVFGLTVSIAAILLGFMRRGTVFKIFINLCSLDIMLDTLYNSTILPSNSNQPLTTTKNSSIFDHKRQFKFSVLFLIMGLIIIGFNLAATYVIIEMEFNDNPLVYVSYALQNASFLIITMQTVFLLFVIKTRFAALNKLICKYFNIQNYQNKLNVEDLYDMDQNLDNQLVFTTTKSRFMDEHIHWDKKIIAKFAQIHDQLNDIIEWINCCYSIQCLGVVAVSFGYVILIFFSFYYALYRPHDGTIQLAAVYLAWFTFYGLSVVSMIIASWNATAEGKSTGVVLHKAINEIRVDSQLERALCNETVDSLRIFSQQLQKRSPIVSCGLFTFDWTLLFSIISASATYLIILIQFDSSMASLACFKNKTN